MNHKFVIITKNVLRALRERIVPNKFFVYRVLSEGLNISAKFMSNPAISWQGYFAFLFGTYGRGTEISFQKIFLALINKDSIVVDVGAHFGFYSILAAIKAPKGKIIAIEPSKVNFNVLLKNIKLNSVKNIIALNVGLGDKKEKKKLRLYANMKTGQMTLATINGAIKREEVIQIVPFDNIWEQLKSVERAPHIVKIDVEGYELRVLKGMRKNLKNINFILCEVHPELLHSLGETPQDIIRILSKSHNIFLISERHIHPLHPSKTNISRRSHIIAIHKQFSSKDIINYLETILKDTSYNIRLMVLERDLKYQVRKFLAFCFEKLRSAAKGFK